MFEAHEERVLSDSSAEEELAKGKGMKKGPIKKLIAEDEEEVELDEASVRPSKKKLGKKRQLVTHQADPSEDEEAVQSSGPQKKKQRRGKSKVLPADAMAQISDFVKEATGESIARELGQVW